MANRHVESGRLRVVAGRSAAYGPYAEAMDDLRRILSLREPLYERADATVDTSGQSVDQSCSSLIRQVGVDS